MRAAVAAGVGLPVLPPLISLITGRGGHTLVDGRIMAVVPVVEAWGRRLIIVIVVGPEGVIRGSTYFVIAIDVDAEVAGDDA